MRLAICDDNELERRILHSLLKKYFSEASINCEFTLYDRGTTLYLVSVFVLLQLFLRAFQFGITFLDGLRQFFLWHR